MNPRDSWATPQYIFSQIDDEFSFTLDACADKNNAKVDRWFGVLDDSLSQNWDETTFLNPPYSNVAPWIAKAIEQARINSVTTVILTNYILDCSYFHEHLPHIAEIRLPLNRIQFDPPEGVDPSSNSKPQQLTIITPDSARAHSTPKITLWANGKKPKG